VKLYEAPVVYAEGRASLAAEQLRSVCEYTQRGEPMEGSSYAETGQITGRGVWVYDRGGLLMEIAYASDGRLEQITSYMWIEPRRLAAEMVIHPDSGGPPELARAYRFDGSGRLVEVCKPLKDGALRKAQTYRYDSRGLLVEWEMYDRDGSRIMWKRYEYDDQGREVTLTAGSSYGSYRRVVREYSGSASTPERSTAYLADGSVYAMTKMDRFGDLVASCLCGGYEPWVRLYSYDRDSVGNWTEQRVYSLDLHDRNPLHLDSVSRRSISYYENAAVPHSPSDNEWLDAGLALVRAGQPCGPATLGPGGARPFGPPRR
jgi:hypothetical protein